MSVKITIEIPSDLFQAMTGCQISEKVSSVVQGITSASKQSTVPPVPEEKLQADESFIQLSVSEKFKTIVSYLPEDLAETVEQKNIKDWDEQKDMFTNIISKGPYRKMILALPQNKLNNICEYFDMSIDQIRNPNPMPNNPLGNIMSMFGGLAGSASSGAALGGAGGKSTRSNVDM